MNTTQSKLLSELGRIARTAHLRLGLYGLLVILSGGILAFLAVVALDWLFWFPAVVRLIVAGSFLLGGAWATNHWMIRPWRAGVGVKQVARIVEDHFGDRSDRIRSAVNFLQGADAGSPDLMAAVIAEAEASICPLDLRDVLKLRPLIMRALILAGAVAVLGGIWWQAEWWPRVGLDRYLWPMSPVEWPRRVHIQRSQQPRRMVAVGESVIVRMKVIRGLSADLRAVMYTRDERGDVSARTMQFAGDSEFISVIDAVSTETDVWFEAGDDSTRRQPQRLVPVARPAIRQATVRVLPPSYSSSGAIRLRPLDDGPVVATVGCTLEFAIHTSKPVGRDVAGEATAWLRFGDGQVVTLQHDHEDAEHLSASMVLARDRTFHMRVVDEYGFAGKEGPEYTLLARPDAPPRVVIEQPGTVTGVTPGGTVPLIIRAEDDFGIVDMTLRARRLTGEPLMILPFDESFPKETSIEGVVAGVRHEWKLADLPLTPGDVVVYDVQATDNFVGDAGTGQIAQSATLRLKIISAAEFDDRVRDDVRHLAEGIRKVLLDQQAVSDVTESLLKDVGNQDVGDRLSSRLAGATGGLPTSALFPAAAGRLSDRQQRLAQRVSQLADQTLRIVDRLELNTLPGQPRGPRDRRENLEALADQLNTTAWGPMSDAAAALSVAARASADPRTAVVEPGPDSGATGGLPTSALFPDDAVGATGGLPTSALFPDDAVGATGGLPTSALFPDDAPIATALNEEQEAIGRLIDILQTIEKWGSFRELLTTVRNLIDRQEDVLRRTRELGARTLGRSLDDLDTSDRQNLRAVQRRQERLADETRQATASLERLGELPIDDTRRAWTRAGESSADETDDRLESRSHTEEPQRLGDALRTARAAEISERMDQAAVALGGNRTAAAALAEAAAQTGSHNVLQALLQRQQLELEALHREMERAADAVARLLQQQIDLHRATLEVSNLGAASDALRFLADTQHRLQRNAGQLAGELTTVPETYSPAQFISKAADAMSLAETALTTTSVSNAAASAAEPHQHDALVSLQAALDELETAAQRAREEQLLFSLVRVMNELRWIRDGQASINRQTIALVETAAERGALGRADNRRAALLANREEGLRAASTELRMILEVVPVFDYVLESIGEDMGDVRDALTERRLDEPLVDLGESIVRRLTQLIGAVDDTLALALPDEFADGQSGASGGWSSEDRRPIPHVAELMVLRAIQMDLNQRTSALAGAMNPQQADEEQLDFARRLGLEQKRLRALTLRVTQQARSGRRH